MRLISNFILLFTTTLTLFSCRENNHSTDLLNQAQTILNSNPDQALILLDSIDNPQGMDRDNYMQYIVAYVGAKQETKADITTDTLIFEAQNYFNNKGDSKNSALANYYAGWVYYTNNQLPQSLESFMHAVYEGGKSNNNFLAGNSSNNIGYIYYEQELLDSAIINYQKALSYYNKVENADKKKLRTLTYIGSAYTIEEKMDSAFLYFSKSLSLAKQTENKPYQFYSLKNLGIVSYGKQEYTKAIDYFQSALALDVCDELEIRKTHLYLLNIYNKKQDLKSAKQYADSVISSLPSVTYNYTVKEMYAALADYYQQSGDYKQALHYTELEKATKEQIEQEANAPALLDANKNFHLRQKDRQYDQFLSHIYFYLSVVGAIALIAILFFVGLAFKQSKKHKEVVRLQKEKYSRVKEYFASLSADYPKIEAEIKAMLEDDDR